jgi:hypothetical protein
MARAISIPIGIRKEARISTAKSGVFISIRAQVYSDFLIMSRKEKAIFL